MSNIILDLIPHPTVIFPRQQTHLFILSHSPLFKTPLTGSTIGICFQNKQTQGKEVPSLDYYDLGVSFLVQKESIESNGLHRENDFKVVTGVALHRLRIVKLLASVPPCKAEVEVVPEHLPDDDRNFIIDSSFDNLKELASDYIEVVRASDVIKRPKQEFSSKDSPSSVFYSVASCLRVSNGVKYQLLKLDNDQDRVEELTKILKVESKRQQAIDQKRWQLQEVYRQELRQKNLHSELENMKHGAQLSPEDDLRKLKIKISKMKLPKDVFEVVTQEMRRLQQMNSKDPEYGVQKKYLETIADLPWDKESKEINNIAYAERVLDRDHAGLEKVKTRILEFIAVRSLKKNAKGSILCLQGPPGVGKTSLGKSVAEALGRKFERIALGGISDEAEVRGHRRTYLGAMPGALIEALLKCKTNNPVILLDEIDKVGENKRRGDPTAALLEVLDPQQNNSFKDHYLGVPFDLSNILFIATANTLDTIQGPLLDRMEVITLSGYTPEEKMEIAKKYLVPKQIRENGIQRSQIEFTESAIRMLIDCYTREAGVRHLERTIGSLCRKVAFQYLKATTINTGEAQEDVIIVQEQEQSPFNKVFITEGFIQQELGAKIFDDSVKQDIHEPGIAYGMAWTPEGGKILAVEASLSRGQGKLEITGQLGKVMKESVLTALGWIKSHHSLISFLEKDRQFKRASLSCQEDEVPLINQDLQVHFPAAAIPKDGPSAGITITIALVSILTKRKVMDDVAMTGEVSLKGAILPVGGVKEKCLAAYARGLKRVILPEKNRKDIQELPKEIKENMTFHFVKNVTEAIVLSIESQAQNQESHVSPMNMAHKPKL